VASRIYLTAKRAVPVAAGIQKVASRIYLTAKREVPVAASIQKVASQIYLTAKREVPVAAGIQKVASWSLCLLCCMQFLYCLLCAFEKLRKATISFVIYVCSSGRKLNSHWTFFH
jgi:hypothetical protein